MTTTNRAWVIMPVRAHREYTLAAISDVLQQTVPTQLLVINQGVEDDFRTELERTAECYSDRVMLWSHVPPLPSLSATWNRALDAAWQSGAEWALVVNNDVRLRPDTLSMLRTVLDQTGALFVSCVGVREEQYQASLKTAAADLVGDLTQLGGPDFSCFLISNACHVSFRFDEHFIPAFCEDLDYHRRLMLAGHGHRIFSVNLPYLHYASATLKSLPPEEADRIRQQIETVSRVYYAKKWGGPVNQETFWYPFDRPTQEYKVNHAMLAIEPPTTPRLQEQVRRASQAPERWADSNRTEEEHELARAAGEGMIGGD